MIFPITHLSIFLTFLVIVGLIIAIAMWHLKKTYIYANRPVNRTARIIETIALGGASFTLLVMLMIYRWQFEPPYVLCDTAPPSMKTAYWSIGTLLLIVIGLILLFAWFRRTILAGIMLMLFFLVISVAVAQGFIFSYKNYVDVILATPVPMEIVLKGDIRGAKVWFNDVYLGETPIKTTADEFFKKIPPLKERPNVWMDHKSTYCENINGRGGRCYNLLTRIVVIPPTQVTKHDRQPRNREYYVRVELNGQGMYGREKNETHVGSRLYGQIQPGRIELDMFLSRWEEEVKELIQRARLADYQVDDAWVAAAESYNDRVWQVLSVESHDEPKLGRVLDAWTTRHYKLDNVRDPVSAQNVLDRLLTEVEKQGHYNTDSLIGRAVELLIPYLVVENVVDQMVQSVQSCKTPFVSWKMSFNIVNSQRNDRRKGFATDPSSDEIPLRDVVLHHLIWKLDEWLDQQDDSHDNLVEQRVIPVLLQVYANSNIEMAAILGGDAYGKFILALYQHPQKSSRYPYYLQHTKSINDVKVNRWLLAAASLDSVAGRDFRRKHADEILAMAEQTLQKDSMPLGYFNGRIYKILDAIFLDVPNGKDNLAVHFWPRFHQYATTKPILGSRISLDYYAPWIYLIRMRPYSTMDMFVEIYRHHAEDGLEFSNFDECVLIKLEPPFRMEVAEALLRETEKLRDKYKPEDEKYHDYQVDVDNFRRLRFLTPCDQAATEMLDWVTEEPKEQIYRVASVKRMASQGRLSIFHLRKLAKAKDPKLRLLVLTSIEKRPTPERRELLRELLEDKDELVRTKAKRVEHELKTLAEKPLPTRG